MYMTAVKRKGERLYCTVLQTCTVLCRVEPSPSYLHNASVQSLKDFKQKKVMSELHEQVPVLISILEIAAKTSEAKASQLIMIAMAAAILLKVRTKRTCKVQTLVVSLLYTGHAAKSVDEH